MQSSAQNTSISANPPAGTADRPAPGCSICLLTPYNNIYLRATPLGGGHFPLAPFFIFLLLAICITLIARIFRSSLLLTGPELLIIWIEMVIGSGIAYTGFARTFLINLTAPIHFATPGNRWNEVLHPLYHQP